MTGPCRSGINLGQPVRSSWPEDTAVSNRMSVYWVTFAKTGDPNSAGLPEWPSFTAASPQLMFFGATRGVRPVPNLEQIEALDAYYAWRRELAKKVP
jgi:para-nitrobenzyl esterase